MDKASLPEIVARLKLIPVMGDGESIECVLRMFSDDLLASIRESCLAQHGASAFPINIYDVFWYIEGLGWRLTNVTVDIMTNDDGVWGFGEEPGCERLDLLLEEGNSREFDKLVTSLASARRDLGGLRYRTIGPAETAEPVTA